MAAKIPLNTQPQEPLARRQDGSLEVHSVFPTIQGEGPDAGTPAVFVRLAGCTLQCDNCDTEYTSTRKLYFPGQLLAEVEGKGRHFPLIVLTGGEPLRQNVLPFINLVGAETGFRVQIETNGTLYLPGLWHHRSGHLLSVVCSPKAQKAHPGLIPLVDAWKYVLRAGQVDPADGLPTDVLGTGLRPARPPEWFPRERIFVQPEDEQVEARNRLNALACVETCKRLGYRMSVQMHKILGLD